MENQILIGMSGLPVYGDLRRAILVYMKAGVKKWDSTFFSSSEVNWMYGLMELRGSENELTAHS